MCKKNKTQSNSGRAQGNYSLPFPGAFVSKQNNKTSQPVAVNFLFASIDSISFALPSEAAAATLQVKAEEEMEGGRKQ